MSNLTDQSENNCQEKPCQVIERIITPREKDIGDFSVRRILPIAKQPMVGPWIFFDHMGPANFLPGEGINVRPHPHINLATVTYLFEGEILHRDSLGCCQTIQPGDINLMVAGKGIVHSERERPEVNRTEHRLNGLQLWLALPEEMEEIDPAFYHYPSQQIPSVTINDVKIRVIKGSAYGENSPVKTFARTIYVEAAIPECQTLAIPDEVERAIYVADGSIEVGGQRISQYQMAVLSGASGIEISADEDSRIAIIGGEPLGKRHIFWNFISSRLERIEQAKQDWKEQRFPKVVGDEDEFIPLP